MPSDNKSIHAIHINAVAMILILVMFAVSCKECPTEPDYDVYLSVEDIQCTQVTLRITLPDSGESNTFELDRNDSTIVTLICTDDDTLVIDMGLEPDADYSYTVRFLKDGKTRAESEKTTIHTLSPTSHEIVWEIDTLGNYGSYVRDAWIVDENNIWIVCNIETDSGTFNAAMWDGINWNLIQVHNLAPLYSIWYFSDDNIWVSSGFPKHWNGNQWTMYHLQNMGLGSDVSTEYIWASSPSNIYFVGYQGSIVYYDGSSFKKIFSGTDISLTDIYGYSDDNILICGYNRTDGRCILLSGNQSEFNKIYESDDSDYFGRVELSSVFQSIWVNNNQLYIATSAGFWQQPISSNKGYLRLWTEVIEHRIWPNCIRGTASNDIFIVSDKGDVIHYNGVTFENYIGTQGLEYGPPQLYSVTCKDKLVVACGILNSTYQGIVYRGHR